MRGARAPLLMAIGVSGLTTLRVFWVRAGGLDRRQHVIWHGAVYVERPLQPVAQPSLPLCRELDVGRLQVRPPRVGVAFILGCVALRCAASPRRRPRPTRPSARSARHR